MIDFRKLVNSTDFLEKLREKVPEHLREKWDEYIETQIDLHEKMSKDITDQIMTEQGEKDAPESDRK